MNAFRLLVALLCLLVGVTVIDGRGNPPVANQVVVIRDGRIAEVVAADGWDPPRGVQVIELPGRFVMPGLIDMHAHVTILPPDDEGNLASEIDPAASEQVLETLLGFGITTVRNPAAPARGGVALRQRVATGEIRGPRILTAGNPLARTRASFGPFVATPNEAAVRQEVRRQAALGVDFIKVYASLSPELVGVAIEEAHALGKPVIGHLQRTTWTEAAGLGVLQIATYNGALALGLEDEIGSVEPGKRADLIVLAADPTALLSNARAISHVFLGGRFLNPAALLESP